MKIDNITLNRMVEDQAGEQDPLRRGEMLRDIQDLIMDLAFRYMPVTLVNTIAIRPELRGYYPSAIPYEYLYPAFAWKSE